MSHNTAEVATSALIFACPPDTDCAVPAMVAFRTGLTRLLRSLERRSVRNSKGPIALLKGERRREMRIKDLRDGMRRVDTEGQITEVGERRTVNLRTGGEAQVAEATMSDGSGSIKLSLWDEQIDRVFPKARVSVTNGYTNSFQGEVRLNVGRYGKLEVSD